MKPEFIIERQGRSFVLYAGLLDLAHEKGLKSISTQLVQIPSEANYVTAVCQATVVMEQDGVERSFSGIGDANLKNVSPQMQTCLIRMAETRAKARALRDATNISMCSMEELEQEAEDPLRPSTWRDAERDLAARERASAAAPRHETHRERKATVETNVEKCEKCYAPVGGNHATRCEFKGKVQPSTAAAA